MVGALATALGVAGAVGVNYMGSASDEGVEQTPVAANPADLEAAALEAGLKLATRDGDDAQIQAFEDGVITPEEYGEAIASTLRCLSSAGFQVEHVGPDWSGTAYDYGVSGGEGREDDYQSCYQRHSAGLDLSFQP